MERRPSTTTLVGAYGVYLGVHCPGILTSVAIQADMFIFCWHLDKAYRSGSPTNHLYTAAHHQIPRMRQ